jgi:integrase
MTRVKTYERKPDRLTVNPMVTEERNRFLSGLATYDAQQRHPKNRWPFDPIQMLYLTYNHGMHISVLTHPSRWDVVVDVAKRELHWSRTKTYEPIVHSLSDDEMKWVPGFIEHLKQIEPQNHIITVAKRKDGSERQQDLCYLRYSRILAIVCKDLELEGLSTRGLRHTLADRVDEGTDHDVAEIEDILGVTPNVARTYSNRPRSKARELMAAGKLPL